MYRFYVAKLGRVRLRLIADIFLLSINRDLEHGYKDRLYANVRKSEAVVRNTSGLPDSPALLEV